MSGVGGRIQVLVAVAVEQGVPVLAGVGVLVKVEVKPSVLVAVEVTVQVGVDVMVGVFVGTETTVKGALVTGRLRPKIPPPFWSPPMPINGIVV